MYAYLLKKMKKSNPKIKQKDIAKLLNLSNKSVSDRFNNKVDWKYSEIFAIRDKWFKDEIIDNLFKKF